MLFPKYLSGKRTYLPVQEKQVQSLGQEDPLEEEMATHSSISSILAWIIPWAEKPGPGGYSPLGCEESDMTEHLSNLLLSRCL